MVVQGQARRIQRGVVGGLAFDNGVLYFIAEDKLFAVELASAKKLWATPARGASIALDDDTAYTWSMDGVTAYDRATGKKRWAAKFEIDDKTTLAIGVDRVLARANGSLVALAKKTGKKLWKAAAVKKPYNVGNASPIIAGDVALCVLVDEPGPTDVLHAVDLASGKLLWTQGPFGADRVSWYCTPVVTDEGLVVVQAYKLYALR